jgi:hypothetical protein
MASSFHPGSFLLVDDMSVDCVIASEVFDPAEFHKVGVEATAYLRIVYPVDGCPEALDSEGECPTQDYVVGTGAARGLTALFIQPGQPDRRVLSARIVRHGCYVIFQLAEVAVPRTLFAEILRRIDRLRGPPVPAT